ncbi:hypothetical protein MYRA21_0091 [Myroides sp. A21]|uniref:hypothetical protein n=1 Tax=Myroides sp. A21 TaxID=1583100 RepID=UPI000585E3B7|nr:hypothetical protein [Myroides sp. A21]AJA67335.1 hypothetical protein MYRA21_0091 [Myroides sp. A21]
MKKLITVLCVFMTLITFAQDKEYLAKLKEPIYTTEDAINLSKVILEYSDVPLKLYKADVISKGSYFFVKYIPESISNEEFAIDEDYPNKLYKKAITFAFVIGSEGEDLNLEKEGVTTYKLRKVQGRYLTLFPYWKKYFNSNVDIEDLSKKGSDKYNGIYFKGDRGFWEINHIN